MSHQRRTKGAHRPRRGLILLNVGLLCTLGAITLNSSADAQSRGVSESDPGSMRVRGEYSVVGGSTLGGITSTLYVLDSANREMIALKWNDNTKALEGIGYRDLDLDSMSDPDR